MDRTNRNATDRIGTESIGKLLVSFSVPAIIGMLVNALYNIVDRIYVGQGIGSIGIAGIAITMPVTMVLMASSMIIGIGANALFAIRLGEGRAHEVEKIMGHAFVLLFSLPALVIVFSFIFMHRLLALLGASEAVLPYAETYLRIILYGGIFAAMSPGINHFIRSDGHPRTSMFTQLLGAGLNIILDPIFIFVFGWGIAGAAWATIISQFVSFVWVMFYFNSGWTRLRFRIENMRLDFRLVLSIMAIGFAPFAMQMAMSLLNAIMNRTLFAYGGDLAVSVMGIIYSILIIIMMPLMGLNQGAQPIMGYNYGARRYDRVKKTFKYAVVSATVFICTGYVFIQLFPELFISAFSKNDPALLELGSRALRICTLMFPLVGFQIMSSNFFQAIGKAKEGTILSLSRQILFLIPLILVLPKFFGLYGVYFALPLADSASCALSSIFVYREMKKLRVERIAVPSSLSESV